MFSASKPVVLTEKAVSQVKKIINEKKIPPFYGLRVGVEGGGCSGTSKNILGFDTQKETDTTYLQDGIPIYIDKGQVMFLAGITIDYLEGEEEQGFTFSPSG